MNRAGHGGRDARGPPTIARTPAFKRTADETPAVHRPTSDLRVALATAGETPAVHRPTSEL